MNKNSASKIFSDDDEIALLKGLAVFWADGRNNKWAEFHLLVKDNLGNHFTKTQLSEKIRTLKRKFDRNLVRANEGEIDQLNPHEYAVFELSKALWGDDIGIASKKKQMCENENGDMEVKGKLGENENGHNEVKGQIGENGNEDVNEILTGTEHVVENNGGKKKKKKKKRKEMGEGEPNKEMRNREQRIDESFEEADVVDAANTILSIRQLVNEHAEGNKKSKVVNGEGDKKSRKKKRKQGDEEKELVNDGMLVDDGQDEGNNDGDRKKKTKKAKLVEECGEASKVPGEQKEVDEHAAKVEISEEVNRVEQHDKEEELLKEGKQLDEHEQDKKSKKQKGVGGHDLKKDLAKQGKQVDDHADEHNIPAKGKQEMGIRVDDFQSAYPLLYTSYNISGYPKVPMNKCVLIGRENAQEFEQKWCELKAKEHRLELKRIALMISRGKRN